LGAPGAEWLTLFIANFGIIVSEFIGIAAAAELVKGKSDQVPVAIVRGAKPLLGEGSIADSIMPREYDLFG